MSTLISYPTDVVANYLDSVEYDREFQMHFHNIYEIYYFVDGEADYIVEGKLYHLTPDTLLLLAPHAIHGVRINSPKHYKRYTIHFNGDLINIDRRAFLLSAFPNGASGDGHEICFHDLKDFNLFPFLESLTNSKHQPQNIAEKLLPIHIEALLAQLVLMRHSLHRSNESITLSKTVVEITNYINQNITEQISLDQLCDYFYISKAHLNRIFRKAIGSTVFDYIAFKRISIAQHLLASGVPAKETAVRVGYNDYSTFFRAYKKITGHSPANEMVSAQR